MSEPSTISKPRMLDLLGPIRGAALLTLRAVEFGFYHLLLTALDRASRLPRNTTMPEAARLYRENTALKGQLDALEAELAQRTEPAPTPMATRAAQVFAYLAHARRRAFPALLPLGVAAHNKAMGDPLALAARAPGHG